MIIFGTQGTTDTRKRGAFYCPTCEGKQRYELKRVRRAFSLFFVPVVPLGEVGRYVECRSCKDTFDPAVLDYDPEAQQEAFEAAYRVAVRRVMIAMMVSDGAVDDAEIQTIDQVYQQLTGTSLGAVAIRREAREMQGDQSNAIAALSELSASLNDRGKEIALRAAYFVAAADGELAEDEDALLGKIGSALDMTPSHCRGVIASLSDE